MDKQLLIARIQQFTAERDAALMTANAANGRVQECQFWLAELEAAEGAPAPPAPVDIDSGRKGD